MRTQSDEICAGILKGAAWILGGHFLATHFSDAIALGLVALNKTSMGT
jgi:hypothetical protein